MEDIEITPSLVKAAARRVGTAADGIAAVARTLDGGSGGASSSGFLVDGAITFLNGRWGVTTASLAKSADAHAEATWQAADAHHRLAEIHVGLAGVITGGLAR